MCSVAVGSQLRACAFALGACLLLLGSGCGSHYVARGSALYADGYYVEAAEVFEKTEARLATSPNDERARFGLYRGATFLKLGDLPRAARWLGYARAIVTSDGDALDADEMTLLDTSLKAVGSFRPGAPERATDSEVAATVPSHAAAAP